MAKSSRYRLARRTLSWAYMTTGHGFLSGECGECSRPGIWQEVGSRLSLRCVPTEAPGLNPINLTKPPGKVLHPTGNYHRFLGVTVNGSMLVWSWEVLI